MKWYSPPAAPERWLWYVITLLVGTCVLFSPDSALAGPSEIAGVLCNLNTILSGTTGRAMATVAIVGMGFMASFGIISWGTALVICCGVALIFGADSIAQALLPAAHACTTSAPFNFNCVGAAASGNLFAADTLATQPNDLADSVIAHVLWFFKNEVGQIMSSMYCALTYNLINPFRVVITLFVVVFGILIITGMSELTMKEAGVFIFKLVLAWAFAMNADWAIGIGYTFFMNFAEEGSSIVLGTAGNNGATLAQPDNIIKSLFSTTTTGSALGLPICTPTTPTGTPCNLPTCTATTPTGTPCMPGIQIPKMCILYLLPIEIILFMYAPYIAFLIAKLVFTYFLIYLRALLHYLTALVLISFLFIFAPFFVAFGLFRTTAPLFQAWLKHLVTFAIQMIVVFGFLAFMTMVPIAQFFSNMLGLLRDYNVVLDHPVDIPYFSFTMHWCGLCQYHLTNPLDDTSLACIVYNTTTNNKETVTQAANAGYILSTDGHFNIISLWNFMAYIDLAKDIFVAVLSLVIVSIVINDYMKKVPELAKHLGGVASAAALGGGGGKLSGPGISFAGMESISAGFTGLKNGLYKNFKSGRGLTPIWRVNPKGLTDALWKGEDSFLGGMLYGTHNKQSREYRVMQYQLKKLKEKKAKAQARGDAIEVDRLEKLILKLESDGAGKFQRGPFKHGIHDSSLSQRDYGYEGDATLRRMESAHIARMRGAYEPQNPGSWYYGMQMPQGMSASGFRPNMLMMRSDASNHISNLQQKLNSDTSLPAHKRARIQRMLDTATRQLSNANSAGQMEKILKHLNAIDGMF